ncbi:unnamed protein product [Rotaria sp. Silwood1]|nr:unnamed protein product [Rotaria sp. Silwood1]
MDENIIKCSGEDINNNNSNKSAAGSNITHEPTTLHLQVARSGNNDSQNTQSTYDFKDINQRLSMIPVDNSIHNRTTVDRNSESTKGIEVDLGNPYEQNLSLATISHNYQNISLTQTRDEETIVDYHVALVVVDDSPNILLSIDANDIETSGQKPISESMNVSSKPHDIDSGELVSTSLCPSNLLVMTLQEAPYDRLNIDLSTLRKDICKEKTSYQDELLSNDEGLVNDNGRKQFKPNGEYK